MNAFLSILKKCVTRGYILSMIFICWQNGKHYVLSILIEYIDGVELCDIPDIDETLKNKIQQSIRSLHEHGMVSGDPHRGNFIIENGEVRIIDLSGKRASAQRKAKDRIDLERHYGIKNEVKDLGYYLLVYRKKIRNLMRRLKGKPAR